MTEHIIFMGMYLGCFNLTCLRKHIYVSTFYYVGHAHSWAQPLTWPMTLTVAGASILIDMTLSMARASILINMTLSMARASILIDMTLTVAGASILIDMTLTVAGASILVDMTLSVAGASILIGYRQCVLYHAATYL